MKYKARLLAKGFTQKYGEDYDSVFSPVLKQSTFRILLTFAAVNKFSVIHFDVKTAFLNGKLEELYISQPEGYVDQDRPHMVYKLHKSIYGLKQASRAWNITLTDVLQKLGFTQSQNDQCLILKNEEGDCIYLMIYVDDFIICHKKKSVTKKLGDDLNRFFDIVDLGELTYFLGIRIQRTDDGSFLLDQEKRSIN
ncbi:hypothetical protein JTB14_023737 [Gonioctena quinquepunctata]|nr:hypothetical protein JTB14_023737 [Gonioctena quinquepunctata]